ncbi:hypothetical protein P4S63_20680 [Pseudoalteromonas sp. B193]
MLHRSTICRIEKEQQTAILNDIAYFDDETLRSFNAFGNALRFKNLVLGALASTLC